MKSPVIWSDFQWEIYELELGFSAKV